MLTIPMHPHRMSLQHQLLTIRTSAYKHRVRIQQRDLLLSRPALGRSNH
ncbi:hypothetical protein H6F89_03955 [Cyanobacteria bacterium FACHB-63]|nr:hypothetical protein [Cyanobacteria bacterium FACHB-63]